MIHRRKKNPTTSSEAIAENLFSRPKGRSSRSTSHLIKFAVLVVVSASAFCYIGLLKYVFLDETIIENGANINRIPDQAMKNSIASIRKNVTETKSKKINRSSRNVKFVPRIARQHAMSHYDKTAHHQPDPNLSEKDMDVLNIHKTAADKLLLPTPIMVMNLPKVGTSSIDHFFRCAGSFVGNGLHVSHNQCKDNPWKRGLPHYCGKLMRWNVVDELPIMLETGNYHVYAQYEDVDSCFFPQVDFLKDIHDNFPNATLLLNLRNVENWVESTRKWGHDASGGVKMLDRILGCDLEDTLIENPLRTSFENEKERVEYENRRMKSLYNAQVSRIRQFAKEYPSHALIEVQIDDPKAGEVLETAFFQKYNGDAIQHPHARRVGRPAECWDQVNVAGQQKLKKNVAGQKKEYNKKKKYAKKGL